MRTQSKSTFGWLIATALLSFYGALALSITDTRWPYLMNIFTWVNQTSTSFDHTIIQNIRLPRALLTALSGSSLAVAGVLSQGIFRNPLASPSLIGTQSGGILLAIIGFHLLSFYNWTYIALLTVIGCFISHLVISALFFALNHSKNPNHFRSADLVIVGFACHIFLGGLSTLILSLSLHDTDKTLNIFKWLFGSYSLATWADVIMVSLSSITGFSLAVLIAYKLDVYSLSDDEARSLSLRTHHLTQQAILGISILIGGSIASCGGIPFVGLMAPHIGRQIVGAAHRRLVVASALIGMILTLSCDTLARTIIYPQELETGILLTTLGAPFFIFVLWKNRSVQSS